jgi:hypothetical protein
METGQVVNHLLSTRRKNQQSIVNIWRLAQPTNTKPQTVPIDVLGCFHIFAEDGSSNATSPAEKILSAPVLDAGDFLVEFF